MADTKIGDLPTDVVTLADGDKFPIADVSALTVDTFATALEIKTHANNAPVFAAGSASANTKPKLTSGALLTTPEAGALEYLTHTPYITPVASERNVNLGAQIICLTTAFTLTSQTALQKMFNSPAGGALTVSANRTFLFKCCFSVTAMSGTSGTASFGFLGTATYTRLALWTNGNKATFPSTTDASGWNNATASYIYSGAANTATSSAAVVQGILRIGTGGTIIPAFGMSIAAAAIIGNDSFFLLTPIGSDTVQSVGNWA